MLGFRIRPGTGACRSGRGRLTTGKKRLKIPLNLYNLTVSVPSRLASPASPDRISLTMPTDEITPRVALRLRIDLLLLAASIALFAALPQLDLSVTSLLHDSVNGFRWSHEPLVRLSYQVFKAKHIGWIPVALLAYLIATLFMRSPDRVRRRHVLFLLALIIVGPLLLVNAGLKDHWGRARPNAVTQFGGERVYTPPLQPAAQCDKNCSFVSGHASAGFVLMGLYWTTRQRRWLAAGIALGTAVGLGRMLQGGHFLSDVVFAFWAVYLSGAVLAWLMLRPDTRDASVSMAADA